MLSWDEFNKDENAPAVAPVQPVEAELAELPELPED